MQQVIPGALTITGICVGCYLIYFGGNYDVLCNFSNAPKIYNREQIN